MKETDFYGIFASDGKERLEETLRDLSKEFAEVEKPDFEGSKDEEEDDDDEEEEDGGDWSADVDLE